MSERLKTEDITKLGYKLNFSSLVLFYVETGDSLRYFGSYCLCKVGLILTHPTPL